MTLGNTLFILRRRAGKKTEEIAKQCGVSAEVYADWEADVLLPSDNEKQTLETVFANDVDTLRRADNTAALNDIVPEYETVHLWQSYPQQLGVEYKQSIDEGLDIAQYEALFKEVERMPHGAQQEAMADALFGIVTNAPTVKDYPYVEPSDYPTIEACMAADRMKAVPYTSDGLREKIAGAWHGRICGCMLGKPVEGAGRNDIAERGKKMNNYPLHTYLDDLGDGIDHAWVDDDTNYTVLYQELIEQHGRHFLPRDVNLLWQFKQCAWAYCTAEKVAICNGLKGFQPPYTAIYKNPYREYIGAQIRGDYFGYICPGDPAQAAKLAWKDACTSHVKNGIYGEMWVAALLAIAAVEPDLHQALVESIKFVPQQSRLAIALNKVVAAYDSGITEEAFFEDFFSRWDESNPYHWCHTVSNAEIVAACLLYGGGEYGRSICMAVQVGFDTDCNGATVGSVIGINKGIDAVGNEWIDPFNRRLDTSMCGVVEVETLIDKTLKHIENK